MPNRILLASVTAIALTGSAFAADLPSPAPPPVYVPPAPVFTWTGVYVGGQIGYGWGKDDATISDGGFANGFTPPPPAPPATAGDVGPARPAAVADPAIPFIPYSYSDFNRINNNASGVIGGAHVGYNYQINQFVLGLEGDVDGSSLSRTANFAPFSNYYQDYIPISIHSNLGVQGSIRGRLGYAFDRVLVYATGGVAFGGFNTNVSTAYINALFYPAFFGTDSFSNTRVGWTVGGGLEYAVTNNWSVRAEYRYTDFGTTQQRPGQFLPRVQRRLPRRGDIYPFHRESRASRLQL